MKSRQVIRGIILSAVDSPWKKATDLGNVSVTKLDFELMRIELFDNKLKESYSVDYVVNEDGSFAESQCVISTPVVEEPVVEEPVVEPVDEP